MNLKLSPLLAHLKKGTLQPIYLLSGNEPLQLNEAADAVRQLARSRGYQLRERFDVDNSAQFNWDAFLFASKNRSLFADKRILELHLPSGKPGDKGGKALAAYCQQLSDDNLLLITAGQLEAAQRRSAWYKTLDNHGITLEVWPVEAGQLPDWLRQRARDAGISLTADAAQLLADRVEGNLLAAAQELEKLRLIHAQPEATATAITLDSDAVAAAVVDSARFSVYIASEAAINADLPRLVRIIDHLAAENEEAVLLLWALCRDLRLLASLSHSTHDSKTLFLQSAIFNSHLQSAYLRAASRYPTAQWQQQLLLAARIDRLIKGYERGNIWDELLQLALIIAGSRVLS
ncbi:MAG: DNA polymerase III subunit delta [Gammaproteobacteria bacterium]|nr:DNA polymerase III subunit delta [Gammaproteobacteria bacterium]